MHFSGTVSFAVIFQQTTTTVQIVSTNELALTQSGYPKRRGRTVEVPNSCRRRSEFWDGESTCTFRSKAISSLTFTMYAGGEAVRSRNACATIGCARTALGDRGARLGACCLVIWNKLVCADPCVRMHNTLSVYVYSNLTHISGTLHIFLNYLF